MMKMVDFIGLNFGGGIKRWVDRQLHLILAH